MSSEKTAFLFPGQGSQYVGMGAIAYERHASVRALYEQANDTLGFDLASLCFNGPADELTDTVNAQPAILATSIAYLQVFLATDGIQPDFVAGHSLGEFTALEAAQVLDLEPALELVRARGKFMKKAGEIYPGKMAAIIRMDTEVLQAICEQASDAEAGELVQIANYNAPGQIVISGHTPAVDRAMALAKAQKARVIPLAVSIASHSPLMAPAAEYANKAIHDATINAAAMPIIANTTAQPLTNPPDIKRELVDQLTSPVRWIETIRYMIEQGVTTFYEIGPKNVLSGMMRYIDRNAKIINVEKALELA